MGERHLGQCDWLTGLCSGRCCLTAVPVHDHLQCPAVPHAQVDTPRHPHCLPSSGNEDQQAACPAPLHPCSMSMLPRKTRPQPQVLSRKNLGSGSLSITQASSRCWPFLGSHTWV